MTGPNRARVVRNAGWTSAVLSLCLLTTTSVSAQNVPFRGWVSLVADGRAGWLENENRIGQLCSDGTELEACYREHLAPAVDVLEMRASPGPDGDVVGHVIVSAVPGRGLSAHYRALDATQSLFFTPDLYLQDWGYGPPYFHQTFTEEQGGWYRLPEGPWDRAVWVSGASGGLDELVLVQGDIVDLDEQGFLILGTSERALRVRPEQDADAWCREGDPPPLHSAEPIEWGWADLVDDRGHLRIRPKYMKGC